ncbi:hypothetical protein [Psychrobacter sp. JCM 18903]|nr:hypothetical protein [Psychrobacter sp. JCM 18903]
MPCCTSAISSLLVEALLTSGDGSAVVNDEALMSRQKNWKMAA